MVILEGRLFQQLIKENNVLRFIVLGLTVGAATCLLWNLFGQKGTFSHIVRGICVGVFSIIVVVINTIYIGASRGIVWDASFTTHTILGFWFFLGIIITCITGFQVFLRNLPTRFHRISAYLTAFFLAFTLLVAFLIPTLRG
ncbi:hypothetical protein HY967_02335 [Candidatus Jorgensenbacteria bacterium]|nr:hypothetical protein [Candidatus Jorgensenbacteria bacterium]